MRLLSLWMLLAFNAGAQTQDSVYAYCVSIGIQHPNIVTAQSLLETGHYKCPDCSLDVNNIFGFHNGKRYLRYYDWKASIVGYLRWQDWRCKDCKDYFDCLIRFWGAPNMVEYVNKLKQML